jgi:hypothetical protein
MKTMKNLTTAMMLGVATTTLGIAIEYTPACGASFTGTLRTIDDTSSVFFNADGNSTINFKSYSYNGGTNAAGATIVPGGFDLIVTLFDPTDRYIEYQNGASSGAPDFDFSRVLPLGRYRAVISAFPNFFKYYLDPNFSAGFPGGGILDADRSLGYAFDIVSTNNATAVPEPADFVGTAIAGLALVGLKRKLSAIKK